MNIVLRRHEVNTLSGIIIHCSIFSHSHWLRAYDEFFVSCWWREHMTNNCRICHVLTPSELFVNVYNVQISAMAFARFRPNKSSKYWRIRTRKIRKSTKVSKHVFLEYLSEKKLEEPTEPAALAKCLSTFYVEARKKTARLT